MCRIPLVIECDGVRLHGSAAPVERVSWRPAAGSGRDAAIAVACRSCESPPPPEAAPVSGQVVPRSRAGSRAAGPVFTKGINGPVGSAAPALVHRLAVAPHVHSDACMNASYELRVPGEEPARSLVHGLVSKRTFPLRMSETRKPRGLHTLWEVPLDLGKFLFLVRVWGP